MKLVGILVALAACETATPPPVPTVPEPPPPAPPDAAVPDAPPPAVVADTQCYANGPKELIEVDSNPDGSGLLHRMTTGPVPDRYIKFTLRPDGPAAFDLVFNGYEKGDYKRMYNARPSKPREKLQVGKSVVARIWVEDGKSWIAGVDVDLHTGMAVQRANHAYPCDPVDRWHGQHRIYVPGTP